MKKKVLFLDLDGTLLNDAKQISPRNTEALNQILARGHNVVISTGRPLKSAMIQAVKLGLDRSGCYLIAYNGAVIYDWEKRDTIFSHTLPLAAVLRVFNKADELGVHIQTYDAQKVLVEPACNDWEVKHYCQLTGMEYAVVGSVKKDLQEAPAKCLLINYEDKSDLLKMEIWLRNTMNQDVDCFFSCDQYLEVVPKNMNKGEAVKMLCEILGIPSSHAVAVGDAANDISMIRAAGVGVAMANGTKEIQNAADYITDRDNNHDGVAEVVEKFFL